MKKILVLLYLLLCQSAYAIGSAVDDFDAAFKAVAKPDYKEALRLFSAGFEKVEQGEALSKKKLLEARLGLANTYLLTGEIKKSKSIVEPILPELEKEGPREAYTLALQNLFHTAFISQNDKKALALSAKLIPLQKEFPDSYAPVERASTLSMQALIQDRNGDTVSAITSQKSAIRLYKGSSADYAEIFISAYSALVGYYEKLNQHADALTALQNKLTLLKKFGDKYGGEINNTLILINVTKERLTQNGPDVDNPYNNNWSEYFAKQKNYDIAIIQRNLIDIISKHGYDSPFAALGYVNYGDALALQQEKTYALQAYDIAREKYLRLYGDYSPNLAELYLKSGDARMFSGSVAVELTAQERKASKADYQKSVDIYSQLYGDAHPLTLAAIQKLYISMAWENKYFESFDVANRLFTAYNEYERNSFTYLNKKQKLAIRQQYNNIGQDFIAASWLTQAYGDDYPQSAPLVDFSSPDWQEQSKKNNQLYDKQLAAYKKRRQDPLRKAFEAWVNFKGSVNAVDNTLTLTRQSTSDESLKQRIDTYFDARKTLSSMTGAGSDWQRQQKQTTRLRQLSKNTLALLEKDIPALRLDKNIPLDELRKRIPENAIYLDFVKLYTYQYAVFSYDRNGEVRLHRLGDDAITIEQRVKKIRDLINDTIDGKIKPKRSERLLNKELAELYDKTIRQIPGIIAGYDELIISAEGLLALMPFGLLYDKDKKQYLVEKYSIRTVPSARALLRENLTENDKGADTVIFADPDFNHGSDAALCDSQTGSRSLTQSVLRNFDKPCIGRLPATAKEASSINTILNGATKTYLQSDASESLLKQQRNPSVLHIATHGFFLPDPAITNPLEKSGLILSGANTGIANKTGEGVVTGLKLAAMDLQGTKLVVLSACETGVGDIEQGEGVAGLNTAFMRAGAKGVVMSLWRVPDIQTAELMKRLYKGMSSGLSAPDALRKAQRSLIKDREHPLAWAAFTYSG